MSDMEFGCIDAAFCRRLPKAELHAHLSGSISPNTLHEIWLRREGDGAALELDDPLKVMSTEKEHFNVNSFFPLFDKYVYKLVDSEEAIEYTTWSVLDAFLEDGVRYLELRTTPRSVAQASVSKDQYVATVLKSIDKFVASTNNAMPTYLILSIDRRQSSEDAIATVQLAIKYRDKGGRIVGIDLCGNPARPINDLGAAFAQAKAAGLKITLHFAETQASSSPAELETLLSYGPNRLGHVIHVAQDMTARIAAAGIAAELCLSCNVLASLTNGGYEEHHFKEWRKAGAPIALCTDDVGVFGSPLSNEHLLAARHLGLTKTDLLSVARSACDSLFAGDHERHRMHRLLDAFADAEGILRNIPRVANT